MNSEYKDCSGKLDEAFRCQRCLDQGWPEDFGSMPHCGWLNGPITFNSMNWNCATLIALRYFGEQLYTEDQSLWVFPHDGSFLTISCYKSRGHTSGVWMIHDDKLKPATLEDCENVLNALTTLSFTDHAPSARHNRLLRRHEEGNSNE